MVTLKTPIRSISPPHARRRMVVFNYDSRFIGDIERTVLRYNVLHPDDPISLDVYESSSCVRESEVGGADLIGHSGGDGTPVLEDVNVPKFYICHSHQWKAKKEGGVISRLKGYIKGHRLVDIVEEDAILGPKGKINIMEYHCLAVTQPPPTARVLAKSKARAEDGHEIEIIEALRYNDKTISVQGHPEEGAAAHILWKFLDSVKSS